MAKKKKGPGRPKKPGRKKKIDVKRSKIHGQRGGWVKGYFRGRRKRNLTNKPHKRNKRRDKETISEKGTRKEERRKKSSGYQMKQLRSLNRPQTKKKSNKTKTKQTRFGKPRGPPKIK